MLSARVPAILAETRESASPTMAQIIIRTLEIIPKLRDQGLIVEAMKALMAIGSSARAKEESALGNALPVVVDTIKAYPNMTEAIAVVSVLMFVLLQNHRAIV